MKNQDANYGINRYDNGQKDFGDIWPLGITPLLAAEIIQRWLNAEHPDTIASILVAINQQHHADVSVDALPPNKRMPWRFQYRVIDYFNAEPAPMPITEYTEPDTEFEDLERGLTPPSP